jgi:hypothetical protein
MILNTAWGRKVMRNGITSDHIPYIRKMVKESVPSLKGGFS